MQYNPFSLEGKTLRYEIGNYVIIHTNGVPGKGEIAAIDGAKVVLDTLNIYEVGASIGNFTPQPYQTLVLSK